MLTHIFPDFVEKWKPRILGILIYSAGLSEPVGYFVGWLRQAFFPVIRINEPGKMVMADKKRPVQVYGGQYQEPRLAGAYQAKARCILVNWAMGSSADDGIYVLLKEVIDNCIDEHTMGYGKQVDVVIDGKTIMVRDFGRGIPWVKWWMW